MWPSISAALLVVILLHVQSSIQAIISTEHFSPCLSRLKSYCNATTTPIIGGDCTDAILDGLLDSNGNRPPFVNDATAIRYSLCESQCGASQSPFSWAIFSQDFSAWLLPFLALISQLPFGAKHRLDNLTSVFLTVGSPTLAGYSLIMTVLNSRWITRKFEAIHYPNAQLAVKILANLQYAPVRVLSQDYLLSSLIILPENDEWWNELSQLIDYKHTWSISAATSIIWVVIAYAFTVVNSIGNLSDVSSNGQSVGTVWLWLICIVIGWLQLSPKSDYSQLTKIFNRANNMAYVASPNGPIKASSVNQLRAISMDALLSGTLFFSDENRSPPIFNYARVLTWSSSAEIIAAAFREASMDARLHRPVDGKSDWKDALKGSDVHDENRRGSPEETDKYCDIGTPQSRWASGVFARMAVASTIALTLQFGTAGASFIGEYFSPTIGLGCRSLSYALYGIVSMFVWMILVTSSILAHYASSRRKSSSSYGIAAFMAEALCWLGKILAVLNTVGIITVCIFQFSNVFDRCYCSASVLGKGRSAAFVTVDVDSTIVKRGWIGGLVLASSCAIGFVSFINLVLDSL